MSGSRTVYRIKEQETQILSFTISDESGTVIPGSSLVSATLTLHVLHTGAIVNGRNAQNVKNANNVAISEAGVVTWTMQMGDTTIADNRKSIEVHRALFVFNWGSQRNHPHEVDFEIENLSKLA